MYVLAILLTLLMGCPRSSADEDAALSADGSTSVADAGLDSSRDAATTNVATDAATDDGHEAVASLDARTLDSDTLDDAGQDEVTVESHCGDGVIEGGEQCEYGVNSDSQTCEGLQIGDVGFGANLVLCDGITCRWDAHACFQTTTCGDGVVEGDEQCDGTNMAGLQCANLKGYSQGTLTCDGFCGVDATLCEGPNGEICGNGKAELDEQCDGDDLNGATCATAGLSIGTPTCKSCNLDYSPCSGGCTHSQSGWICK
jgi:hypothetical protein